MFKKGILRLLCTCHYREIVSLTKLTKYCNTSRNALVYDGLSILRGKSLRLLHTTNEKISKRNPTSNIASDNMKGVVNKKPEKAKLRAVRLREQQQRKTPGKQYTNSKTPQVSIQVLGTGSKHSPPSVMIIAGMNRILLNCGEGMQRLLLENGIKSLSRFEHLMFTRLAWDNIGGAIGMSLTLRNIGLPKAYFHGPPNLEQFVEACQLFTKNEAIDIVTRPYTEGTFETESLVITPVPLFATSSTQEDVDSTTYSSESNASDSENDDEEGPIFSEKRKARFERDKSHGSKRRKLQTTNLSLAYVFKLHPKPGTLLIEKCKAMGLKPFGPHLGVLKRGQPYTTEDGRTINPKEVLGPAEPQAYFIILECPSEDYIDAVITSQVLSSHHGDHGDDTAKIVVHMCPEKVIQNPAYKQWMHKFGATTEHLVLNESCESVTHNAVYRLQTKLNYVHDGIFPTLPVRHMADAYESDGTLRIKRADNFTMYHIRPAGIGWDRKCVLSADIAPYLKEIEDLPQEFHDSMNELKKDLGTMTSCRGNAKYPEVVFTGTGSAIPNKDRNVTGILLNISETQSMILDCGEGTYGQLCRFYGNDSIDDVIANLQGVFVSHIHADHHSGFIKILQEWQRIMKERGEESRDLIVVGPRHMRRWLYQYNHDCETILDKVRFIDLRTQSISASTTDPNQASLIQRLDFTKFETVPVQHCFQSYGVVLTHKAGWKLAYSGDCMPSDALVKAGQNADLLIHEATLEDGMNEEAKEKRHSMISEAIDVGARMNAKFTLLTHFSQRYMKVPYFRSEVSGQVGIAFDNMRVSLSELPILPKFLPVMRNLFADKISLMEKDRERKADKVMYQQELMMEESSKAKSKAMPSVRGEISSKVDNKTDCVKDKDVR